MDARRDLLSYRAILAVPTVSHLCSGLQSLALKHKIPTGGLSGRGDCPSTWIRGCPRFLNMHLLSESQTIPSPGLVPSCCYGRTSSTNLLKMSSSRAQKHTLWAQVPKYQSLVRTSDPAGLKVGFLGSSQWPTLFRRAPSNLRNSLMLPERQARQITE